jgi:hypothetical protein
MIEFVLVSAFFWVPLILLIFYVGFRASRAMQVVQLVNDVSLMWAQGSPVVDFSKPAYQTLLTDKIAGTLGLQGNGGGSNQVTGGTSGALLLVLSEYFYVNSADSGCTNGTCTNKNQYVLERRIMVGNKNLISTTILVGSIPASGTLPVDGFNASTGTCEKGDGNTPEGSPPTTCQFTFAAVQIPAATFTSKVMTTLPTTPDVGTAYLVEAWFQDFTGQMVYERSID